MSKIDSQTETKIVAMIARGDTYSEIRQELEKQDISITDAGLSAIKKRNSQALSFIQNKLAEHELSRSTRILDKSRTIIEKRLDAVNTLDHDIARLRDLRETGEIDDKEYQTMFDTLLRDAHISIKDLTTVSKEFFNQSQIEAGKPTSITETPEQAKRNLQVLLQAINNGKEEDIVKAIFLDA